MKIELDIRELESGATRKRDELGDLSRPMREIAEIMDQRVRSAFRLEEDPWGNSWPGHAASTIRKRNKAGNFSAQVLVDSTALFTSITPTWDSTSAAISAGEGASAEYAQVHQFGLKAGRGAGFTMPQRAFMPIASVGGEAELPPDWWLDIVQPLNEFLEQE